MPKKTLLSDIESRLPNFVVIIPETYRGARYNASFKDIEYNELFEAIPLNVIKLQHGCKSRSNQKRKESKGYTGCKGKKPLNQILERLPPYLEMDVETYKGARAKATFRDKEYNEIFEAYVCNVIRDGKGYCQSRRAQTLNRKIYTPVQRSRSATYLWRKKVIERDKDCQVCHSQTRLESHHIYSWTGYPEKRFDINNGIILCRTCHKDFHSKYDKGNNTLEQFTEYLNKKSEALSSLAMELKTRI